VAPHLFDWSEVVDAVHNDLLITDQKGVVIYANKATEKLYLIPREEIIGKTVDELEKRKIFTPSITKKVLKEKRKQTLIQETKIGTKVLVTANPIFDDQGDIKWVVSYSYDVTELLHLKEYVNKMEEEMKKVRHELFELRYQTNVTDGIIVSSPMMKQVMESAKKIADYDVTVLLTGESGVGKNVVVRYIHNHSKRKNAPLVEINCGSIPESLLESELFGYEPGSFSGAKNMGKKGLVEEAEGGTLFLDEIGELSLNLQVKLLTLIQEKKFYRVGGTKLRQVNFRIIAATNADIKQKVQEGKFRKDLFFRLSVVPIHIPPLRERPQDVYAMIMDFTHRFNHLYEKEKRFSQQAIERMMKYDWPGNVRELEHMVERLILTVEGPTIEVEDLPDVIAGSRKSVIRQGKTLSEMMDAYEAEIIKSAYAKCKSTTKLAEYLGISQPTAVRKIQKYVTRVKE
jgi:PAS domain S-box-containing protein